MPRFPTPIYGSALALALAAGSGACGTSAPAWHQETGYRWRELSVPRGNPGFTAMTAHQTGISFENSVPDSVLLGNRILAQGAGIALGDVDGDGLADIYLARTDGSNALYRNLGGWRFEDITGRSGTAAPGRHSTGAALADLDGDGDLDLVLLSTSGPNSIFQNDGQAHFTERHDAGLDPTGRGSTTAALADIDGDGDLDLYITNYKPYTPADSASAQDRAFAKLVRQPSPGKYEVIPEHRRDFKVDFRADMGGMVLTMRAEPDQLYLNDGHGRFSLDSVRLPRDESFGLDARFADLNGDGAPDLYVVNDFEDPDRFFLNDGRGGFRPADWTVQRTLSNSGMGVDVGDIDGDGLPDLFEVDMLSNDPHRLKTQIPTHTAIAKRPGDMQLQPQVQRNTLFRNRGDGTFVELAAFAGVETSGWSWATMFLDVDLDGWQDILIANGHVWDVMDGDTQERLAHGWSITPWQRQLGEYPRLPLRNVAYRNRGDLTFDDAGAQWGFGTEEDISHSLAAADLDGDGDLDVVVNRLQAPPLILRNNAGAARIAVRVTGNPPNTRAVGAMIRVRAGAVPFQQREVAAGGLYLAHSDYLASFATGSAATVSIEVDWRDGRRTTIPGARPNRLYEIAEATSSAPPEVVTKPPAPPLFEDVSPMLGGHSHTEDLFDDWGRQFLLPDALSRLGPGVSWFDLDDDGDEDLIIGAGTGGRIALFRNDAGRMVPLPAQGPAARFDFTTILGLRDSGGTRLLAGVSTWQARAPAEMTGQPAAVSLGVSAMKLSARLEELVGSHEAATGPMALADYDGDGDLDLFVGSRAVPLRYPIAASSGLFRNESGRFVFDDANSQMLHDVGLVSSALFADIDGDGDDDLLIAREWGSIVLLLNQNGRFGPAPDSWGLSRWTSRWNGLATGDLDGDGRLDVIATSWGRNTGIRADSARPLVLVHGPFGAKGEEEMLMARRGPTGGLVPLEAYTSARVAIPSLVSRLQTFSAYADATVDQILGPAAEDADRLEAVTLDHMVFLNRGGRFDAMPLPAEAQLAPAFSAGIADFDGDGFEDVFLAQNFSPTPLGAPRYDAGRGLLLKGNGKGGLDPLPGARSGLLILGDQRGAAYADFDGDGRLDLAVSQNGAATRLFHNRGAAPGLRVRLVGPAGGVGAQIRVVYGERLGAVREVQAGSGYWSENGAIQIFGLLGTPTAVWVRWPGGVEATTPVPPGSRDIMVRR